MSGNFCFSFVFGYGNVDNEVEHRKNKNYLSRLVSFLCHWHTYSWVFTAYSWVFCAEKVWASYQFLAQAHFLSFHVKIDHDCIMSEGLWCRFGKLHNKFTTFQRLFERLERWIISHEPRGGYSQKNWVGVCGPLLKTLTLFMTKICDFPYPIYDLTKNLIPY